MNKRFKIAVIGSNSFSGSDFIDLLLEDNNNEVIGISRSPEKKALFLAYKRHKNANFKFHQLDLNKEMPKIIELLDFFEPEYIVNFAAQSEVAPSWEYPEQWFQTNVVAITRLAQGLKNKNYLKRYVHISSPEVYGACVGTVKEDALLNPSTPYAASKAAGDLSLFTFFKNFNFPLLFVRSTNVYGAHQQLFKIIPLSIIHIKLNKNIELHGGGCAIKSYIHIRDISNGELAIMKEGRLGEIYHLSPDGGFEVRDIVSKICKKMGVSFEKSTRIVKERLGQDAAYVIDSSKARETLGWNPGISIEKGLDDVIEWIENEWNSIRHEPISYMHKE